MWINKAMTYAQQIETNKVWNIPRRRPIPLLCVALKPLSTILNQTTFGSTLKSRQRLNHLLYMDDLKPYAKEENVLKTLVNTVDIFITDIEWNVLSLGAVCSRF